MLNLGVTAASLWLLSINGGSERAARVYCPPGTLEKTPFLPWRVWHTLASMHNG